MLWTWPTSRHGSFWGDLGYLQREMNRLFAPYSSGQSNGGNFPAVNIWTGPEQALLTAEVPGLNPDCLEVTVKDNTITLRGHREPDSLAEGESYLRQERGAGSFVRSFALPFQVDNAKVTAQYQKGILQLTLPRAEADKPKKITVKAG